MSNPEKPDHPPKSLPIVVCLAGESDAGKTTLIETLLPKLTATYRVATVKSIHHDIEPDTPGTDTHRHREAGADAVVGVTPSYTFEITPGGKGANQEDDSDPPHTEESLEHAALAGTIRRLGSRGYDLVLVEGFASAPLPTIAVGDSPDGTIGGEIIATEETSPTDLVGILERLEPPESFVRDAASDSNGYCR
jgi:molybdopterin-guanine dinucleotide biosynthesis protein B